MDMTIPTVARTLPNQMSVRTSIAYQPALDGVRALAVAAVVLFHAEVSGFTGGYLGVSMFFTLSGYLITSLLVHEHDSMGRIALGEFYRRRVRRLLPASAVCLGLVALAGTVSNVFDGVVDLRKQLVGSVLQVANWVFLIGDGSYQELFQRASGTSSPLEHFWSLAIEEQFYWVWPPAMVAILSRSRNVRSRIIVVALIAIGFSVSAPVIAAVWGPDAAYWSTPTRIAEILIGALLAVVLAGRTVDRRLSVVAPVSLLALAACIVTFPSSGGPAYHGALPLVAVASAGLVLGLQIPSALGTLLSRAPLVWLGRISYGVYLFHWPIFVILDEQRTNLDGIVLLAVRIGLSLGAAQISYVLIERPIRTANAFGTRSTFGLAAMSTAVVAFVAIVVVPVGAGEYWISDEATVAAAAIQPDDAELQIVTDADPHDTAPVTVPGILDPATPRVTTLSTNPLSTNVTSPTTTSTGPPLPTLTRPVRIVVAGDSTANATATGLIAWAAAHPELAQVDVITEPGCGFVRGGERWADGFEPNPARCAEWIDAVLPQGVSTLQPDVVMLMVTSWDVLDHRWGSGLTVTPLDAGFAARIAADYSALSDALLAGGAGSVAFVRQPVPNLLWMNQGTGQQDPARHDVVYAVMDQLRASRVGDVGVIALDAWLADAGLDDDRGVRPDGVHWDPSASAQIAEDYLGEQLIRIALG